MEGTSSTRPAGAPITGNGAPVLEVSTLAVDFGRLPADESSGRAGFEPTDCPFAVTVEITTQQLVFNPGLHIDNAAFLLACQLLDHHHAEVPSGSRRSSPAGRRGLRCGPSGSLHRGSTDRRAS